MLRKLLLASALLFAALVQPCSAALVELTWTGLTFSGNDGLGLFGPPAPVPADVPYTATYRFDTSIGFVANATNGSEQVLGGVLYARPTPLISASITINGITVDVSGAYAADYYRSMGRGSSSISSVAQPLLNNPQPDGGELFQRVFRSGNFYGTPNLDQPGTFSFDSSDNRRGHFSYLRRNSSGNIIANTGIQIIPRSLSIRIVPEPATYVLATLATAMALAARRWSDLRRAACPQPTRRCART